MQVTITSPKGYCQGVANAIKITLETKQKYPDKEICVLGMLVHNNDVVNSLRSKGIRFIDYNQEMDKTELIKSINPNSVLIFTAHGHEEELDKLAAMHGLLCIDAVCDRVKASMNLIKNALNDNKDIIYIGKKNHPETNACLSLGNNVFLYEIDKVFDFTKIHKPAFIANQTTLSVNDLKDAHNDIELHCKDAVFSDEICNATRMRQEAVRNISDEADLIYIIGSPMSANTKSLFEIAKATHKYAKVVQIENKKDIDNHDLEDAQCVFISGGASTPASTINDIYEYIRYFK